MYREEQDAKIVDNAFMIMSDRSETCSGAQGLTMGIRASAKQGFLAESILIAKLCYKVLQHTSPVHAHLRVVMEMNPHREEKIYQQFVDWIQIVETETGVVITLTDRDSGTITEMEMDVWLL